MRNAMVLVFLFLQSLMAYSQKPPVPNPQEVSKPIPSTPGTTPVPTSERQATGQNVNKVRANIKSCPFATSPEAISRQLPGDLLEKATTEAAALEASKDNSCRDLGVRFAAIVRGLRPRVGGQPSGPRPPGGADPSLPSNPSSPQPPPGKGKAQGQEDEGIQSSTPSQSSGPVASNPAGTLGGPTAAPFLGAGTPVVQELNCIRNPDDCYSQFSTMIDGISQCRSTTGGFLNALAGVALKLSSTDPKAVLWTMGASALMKLGDLFRHRNDSTGAIKDIQEGMRLRLLENIDANLACSANSVYYKNICWEDKLNALENDAPEKPLPIDAEKCLEPQGKKVLTTLTTDSLSPLYSCLLYAKNPKRNSTNQTASQCFACTGVAPSTQNPAGTITKSHIESLRNEAANEASDYRTVSKVELPRLLGFAKNYHEDKARELMDEIKRNEEDLRKNPGSRPTSSNSLALLIEHCHRLFLTQYTSPNNVNVILREPHNKDLMKQCTLISQCLNGDSPGTNSIQNTGPTSLLNYEAYKNPNGAVDYVSMCEGIHTTELEPELSLSSMVSRLKTRGYSSSGGCVSTQSGPASSGSGTTTR